MKRNFKVFMVMLASVCVLMSTVTEPVFANDEIEVSQRLNGRGYVAPRSLGEAVNDTESTALTSAVYDEIGGVLYAYSVANGGFFNVVDVAKNELVYSEFIQGVNQAWAHTVTDDHVVYMAALGPNNDGWLLRYNPELKKVEDLGIPFPGYQFWSITSDGKDNIFIGTFKENEAIVIQYNIATHEYTNLGIVDPEANLGYVRSIAYHDNKLYVGMGVTASVYQLDLTTKEYTNITKNAYDLIDKPGNKNDIKYVYNMSVVKNHLVARFDHDGMNAILFYNLIEQKWEDKVLKKEGEGTFGAYGWNDLVDRDGTTYVSFDRKIHEINTNTLEDRAIDAPLSGQRGGALYDFGEGLEFVTLERLGVTVKIRVADGKRSKLPNVMQGSAMKIHNLGKDNNGDLYVTTYPGGPKGAKYSMQDEKYTSYGQGQAEGLVAGEAGEMYFGIYPGATIERMNTETLEKQTLFNLKDTHEQDRPYIMKYEDGLLLIGTIPDYQKVGGTLSIYDPKTQDLQTHRNVVEGQSIVGLAKRGNQIFGSTTTKGGLDAAVTATKPVIFVWDIDAKSKVKEIELELPGLNQTPMISGLTFDDQGMLWGAVDGFLFTLNPDTLEVENYANIYPNIGNRGMWRPVHIEFGEDGFVYSDVGGKLTVLDPSNDEWEYATIQTPKEVDFMTLSHDKYGNENIYIVQADPTEIEVVEIIDVDPTEEDDRTLVAKVLKKGTNLDFEDAVEEEVIPGWSSLFAEITPNVGFEISTDKVLTGKQSLKLHDGNETETVFVISDPIEIQEDETYTVETMLYLEDGMNTLMIRYYDDEGTQVGKDADGVNIIHVRSGYKEWRKITATVKAPVGATNARISLGSSKYFQTTGAYYDNVRLYSEKTVDVLKLKKIEAIIEQFNLLDSTKYTEESYKSALTIKTEAEKLIKLAKDEELILVDGMSEDDFENRIIQTDVDSLFVKLEEKIKGLVKADDTDNPTDGDDDKPTDGDDDKPTDGDDNKPTDKDDDKPIDKDDDKPTDGDSEKPTDGNVEKPVDSKDKDKETTSHKEDPKTGVYGGTTVYALITLSALVMIVTLRKKRKSN